MKRAHRLEEIQRLDPEHDFEQIHRAERGRGPVGNTSASSTALDIGRPVGPGKIAVMSHVSAGSGRGRPPDPDLQARVFAATLDLYAEVGWARFSLDVLARRARVGKAALYHRWGSKEKLIVDALADRRERMPKVVETGSLRSDLVAMARHILADLLGHDGLLVLRAQVEAKVYPDLFGREMERVIRWRAGIGRPIVLRAVDRGELPRETSPALILDAVAGILTNHVLSTPADKLPDLAKAGDVYTERIVDFVLAAARIGPVSPHPPSTEAEGSIG
ncbi:TetR/AcrR family transcriptional regulator [Streptomyces sp. NPDC058475]|uniref:TetR/AcrR family transcriptional regulator n=1 Tax=Streptomyces sp. NPDC058475 TaxID=3346518 RepID=UPI00365BD983